MKKLNEKRILSRRESKKAMETCERVAVLITEILSKNKLEQGGREQVYDMFYQHLGNLEYFVMMDSSGLALCHTNRLREGIVFDDEVAKKEIASQESILQVYHRNTGEILVDAACPIFIKGRKEYTLRAGLVIQQKRLWLKNFGIQVVPLIGALAITSLVKETNLAISLGLLGGLVLASITAYFTALSQKHQYVALQRGMQSLAQGNLTYYQEAKNRDELGQLTFEINKLALGLKTLMGDFSHITERVTKAAIEQEAATDEVSKGTENIAATIEEVTAGSQEQASSVQQVAQFMKQIIVNIREMEKQINQTLQSSQNGMRQMQKGNEAIEVSMGQMKKIDQTFKSSALVIEDLADKSDQIGNIINTITAIAEQTNLLALNAAIEAARAGDHGKGFAVVADEVRKLAEDSNQAAGEIMNIITETQAKTREAVEAIHQGSQEVELGNRVINQTGTTIKAVSRVLQDTTDQMQSNKRLAEELMKSGEILEEDTERISEISQATSLAMQDISATIQQQTVMAEQISNSASQLTAVSEELRTWIQRFKLN
ncbi:methyl-accepting chemotaxis protein [Alkaliphilus crotonatoxidans]